MTAAQNPPLDTPTRRPAPVEDQAAANPRAVAPPAHTLLGASSPLWLATATLWRRDMVRFFRQRDRIIGALATPLVFWIFLGSGLSKSFVLPTNLASGRPNVSYLEYFFPGTVVMILLFTAIFSTISVIEDRREGFLQGVLVAPISRLAIVLGKVLGGATIATIQGLLFLAIWPLVAGWPGLAAGLVLFAHAAVVMFVLAVALTALGFCIAWPMDSTAGFHAVMNLVLLPMWFLSGAVFPIPPAQPIWLRAIMLLNPLTYGMAAFSGVLAHGRPGFQGAGQTGAPVNLWQAEGLTLLSAIVIVLLAAALVKRPRKDGLA